MIKTVEQRINNIIGQLEGAKKMANDKNRDFFSLIIQLKAIRSAMSSLMDKVINEEMDHCFLNTNKKREKIAKILKELINK
jgi:DNA-binding FrmR family transcriptional regulator